MVDKSDQTTALALVEQRNAELDLYPQMVMSIQTAKAQLAVLREFVAMVMMPGEDYGVIPGTGGKPTLLKSGAEKLNEIYGFAPLVEIVDKVEDWDAKPPFFRYLVKVTLVSKRSGKVVAEGLGECNSRESRYADRWVSEKQAREMGLDIETLPYREREGKFGRYKQYLVQNDDIASLVNTIIKMAEKRALVGATLKATRTSGIFTQDLEDIKGCDPDVEPLPAGGQAGQMPAKTGTATNGGQTSYTTRQPAQTVKAQPSAAQATPQRAATAQRAAEGDDVASPAQTRAIYALCRQRYGMSEQQTDERCQALYGRSVAALSKREASALITDLNDGGGKFVAAKPETVVEGEVVDAQPAKEAASDWPFPGQWFWEPLAEVGFEPEEVKTLAGADLAAYSEGDLRSLQADLLAAPAEWQFLAARKWSRGKTKMEIKRRGLADITALAEALQEAELAKGA